MMSMRFGVLVLGRKGGVAGLAYLTSELVRGFRG